MSHKGEPLPIVASELLQARCSSCQLTNNVKAIKVELLNTESDTK